jgi:hypothetical protein
MPEDSPRQRRLHSSRLRSFAGKPVALVAMMGTFPFESSPRRCDPQLFLPTKALQVQLTHLPPQRGDVALDPPGELTTVAV